MFATTFSSPMNFLSGILFFFVLLFACAASSQPLPVATITVPGDQRIYIGKPVETILEAHVADGFRIQAARVEDESIMPTNVEMTASNGITVGPATLPSPKPFRMKETTTDIPALGGTVLVQFIVTAPKTLKPGTYTLQGTFHYQACDSTMMFSPVSIPFR